MLRAVDIPGNRKDTFKKMEKQEVKCPKCSHKFITKSELIKVTCNSCSNKFNREENFVEVKK